ncbi:MAG: PD-(D/E)XK nuclease family protein [Dehalococcoidia bacterium]|nr:MAG: PD-(D/E)XK nuclease family protein [Dehalococcoidia bacterium]
MPVYSHSRLSAYRQCPLKYKLRYIDRIKRDTEGIEAFLGSRVHETLQKCYDDVRRGKLNRPEELLDFYRDAWQRNWHDEIAIARPDMAAGHYQKLGEKMLLGYCRRFAPFDTDITVATEMMLNFALDDAGKYRMMGYIDRLVRAPDGAWEIHDYKTGAHLPAQAEADSDRQLALYQIGIRQKWPDIEKVRLIWHYLAFEKDIVSTRSDEDISRLAAETTALIDKIEKATDFPPADSNLCGWCEYPDLCPAHKHECLVESLPPDKFKNETGVSLVDRYAELKDQAASIEDEMDAVRAAIIDYAQREGVTVVRGSSRKAAIRRQQKLKFPGKSEEGREGLECTLMAAGKWPDVSQLDTAELAKAIERGEWDKKLADEVAKYSRLEETTTVFLSKPREDEARED